MSEHTIRYDYEPGYCGELIRADGVVLATFNDEPDSDDARRLVACWNACVGMTVEQIEAMRTPGAPVPIPHTFAPPDADTDDSMEGGKNG